MTRASSAHGMQRRALRLVDASTAIGSPAAMNCLQGRR
jgi:hypothetical protein